jgi:hypothetical protein
MRSKLPTDDNAASKVWLMHQSARRRTVSRRARGPAPLPSRSTGDDTSNSQSRRRDVQIRSDGLVPPEDGDALAVLSEIHGNLEALEAVLGAAATQKVAEAP